MVGRKPRSRMHLTCARIQTYLLVLSIASVLAICVSLADLRKLHLTTSIAITEATNQYFSVFEKSTPRNFEKWALFAYQKGCRLEMDAYAQIAHDLKPWASLREKSPGNSSLTREEIRSMAQKGRKRHVVEFEKGRFSREVELDTWATSKLVFNSIAHLMPHERPFTLVFSLFDEPSLVVSDDGSSNAYKDVDEIFNKSKCFRETLETVPLEDSPLHLFAGNNTLRSLHGFLQHPHSFISESSLAPIFTQAVAPCYSDIAFPLTTHWQSSQKEVVDPYSWEVKLPVLFWRGSNTGGAYNIGTPWRNYHRTRLMDWTHSFAQRNPSRVFDASNSTASNSTEFSVDIGYHTYVQVDDFTKQELEELYGRKGVVSFHDMLHFKFLLVVDGNTWPARLQDYLQTNSVILYAGIFRDWFNWQLVPWVHYVPVRLDFSDLEARVKWLMEHDEEARTISENARKFMKKAVSLEQVQCYAGLMLLEYSEFFE
ncbi:glycosyl transferase family 90-domain-containing protein [Chytriomyces sp. MP71]|nr:glycosyl transferase family 90-domain-containing protein [Chytriomyces sp. MP71]